MTMTILREDAGISADGQPWVDSIPSKVSGRSEGREWSAAGYSRKERSTSMIEAGRCWRISCRGKILTGSAHRKFCATEML